MGKFSDIVEQVASKPIKMASGGIAKKAAKYALPVAGTGLDVSDFAYSTPEYWPAAAAQVADDIAGLMGKKLPGRILPYMSTLPFAVGSMLMGYTDDLNADEDTSNRYLEEARQEIPKDKRRDFMYQHTGWPRANTSEYGQEQQGYYQYLNERAKQLQEIDTYNASKYGKANAHNLRTQVSDTKGPRGYAEGGMVRSNGPFNPRHGFLKGGLNIVNPKNNISGPLDIQYNMNNMLAKQRARRG